MENKWRWNPSPITPDEVYKGDWRFSIKVYEVVDFRPPIIGEKLLTLMLFVTTATSNYDEPRLILRKKGPRRIVWEECSKEEAYATGALRTYAYGPSSKGVMMVGWKLIAEEALAEGEFYVKQVKDDSTQD